MCSQNCEILHLYINDILDYSKIIHKEKLSLKPSNFNLKNLINDILDLHSLQAKNKNLTLKTAFFPQNNDFFILFNDEFRLKQILMNIVGNAVKFTHQGSILIEV